MIDSTNPRQLADNIRKLWDKFKSISGDLLPSRSTATTGQILKLTGENKTPSWGDIDNLIYPLFEFKQTEEPTHLKFMGKDVYCAVVSGTIVSDVNTSIDVSGLNIGYLLQMMGSLTNSNGDIKTCNFFATATNKFTPIYNATTQTITHTTNGTAFTGDFVLALYYTHPDPAPETRDDDTLEEVKETKTRKKTTK